MTMIAPTPRSLLVTHVSNPCSECGVNKVVTRCIPARSSSLQRVRFRVRVRVRNVQKTSHGSKDDC